MTLHRFFVNPNIITNDQIVMPEDISHQISQVLRLKNSEQIIILDNSGNEFLIKLTDVNKKHTTGEIIEKRANRNEPDKNIHLYMALIVRDNFELVLQKSVELGVSEITPLFTERTQFDRKFIEGKYERWQKIIKEAAEQSERGKLPVLHQPINFESAINQAKENGKSLIASEYSRNEPYCHPEQSEGYNIFIGPEGGFTEQEIVYAKQNKVKTISLGKTILRAETAAIALTAKFLI